MDVIPKGVMSINEIVLFACLNMNKSKGGKKVGNRQNENQFKKLNGKTKSYFLKSVILSQLLEFTHPSQK